MCSNEEEVKCTCDQKVHVIKYGARCTRCTRFSFSSATGPAGLHPLWPLSYCLHRPQGGGLGDEQRREPAAVEAGDMTASYELFANAAAATATARTG